MSASPPPDRYEPLPGLLGLPAFLIRKLSPRGRRIALVVGSALALSIVALIVLLVPDARRAEQERTARKALAAKRAAAARLVRLTREARPHSGRGPAAGGLSGNEALRARRGLFAAVEASILEDARGRGPADEPYRDSACFAYPTGLDPRSLPEVLERTTARLECLAITSVLEESEYSRGSLVGQPYRARVDFSTGRYAWCKIVQRPGEGAIGRPPAIRVSRRCGGDS